MARKLFSESQGKEKRKSLDAYSSGSSNEPKKESRPSLLATGDAEGGFSERAFSTNLSVNFEDKGMKTLRSVSQFLEDEVEESALSISSSEESVDVHQRGYWLPKDSISEKNLVEDDMGSLPVTVYVTADILKEAVDACGVVVYMIDKEDNIIYLDPHRLQHRPKPGINFRWNIQDNSTVASYSASTKKFVCCNDIRVDERFPDGVGWTDNICAGLLSVVCAPIVTPEGEVISVFEVYRQLFKPNFTTKDVQKAVSTASWVGAGIYQNQLRSGLIRQQQLNNQLLKYINRFFSNVTMKGADIFTDITNYAKKVLAAEKAFVYYIDMTGPDKLVEYYSEGLEDNTRLFKKRKNLTMENLPEIVKHVIEEKVSVNIGDIFEEEKFKDWERMERAPNELRRSVLCAPIKDDDKVAGVLLMTNKKSNEQFTILDDANYQTFVTYFSLAFHHYRVKKELQKTICSHEIDLEVLTHHFQSCSHDLERLKNSKLTAPSDFFEFTWYPFDEDYAKMDEYVLIIYRTLLGNYFMKRNNMPKFVSIIKKSYRNYTTLYHNFEHGYTVCHSAANILIRNKQYFNGIEMVAMLIGSLGHDCDHRAQTNSFVYLTKHPMAQLYDSAILENHHFYITNMIIKECNLFSYLNQDVYKQLINEIETVILHTDLALHFRSRARLAGILAERQFKWPNPDHRFLMKGIIMTACDLTGQSKTFKVADRLLTQLYQEFYVQGDEELKLGLAILPMMDRSKISQIPEDQVRFLSFVVIPCNELLYNLFPNTKEIIDNTRALMEKWKDIAEKKEGCTWEPNIALYGTAKSS